MSTKVEDSFFKHVMIYGTGTLLLQAGSFLLLPLYTFYLTKEDYGTLDILSRAGQALNICLMVQGIRLAATNFYKKAVNDNEKQQVVATLLSMLIPILIIAFFLVYYFSDSLKYFLKISSDEILLLGFSAVFLEAILSLPLTTMQARLESLFFVKISLVQFFLRTCFIIFNVVILDMGVKGVLIGDCTVLAIFVIFLVSRELIIGSIKPDIYKYKNILLFTLPFIPAASLGFFIQSADRFWLAKYVGIAEVGLFALAMKLLDGASSLVVTPVVRVWQARMYDVFDSPNASYEIGIWYSKIFRVYLFSFFTSVVFRSEIIKTIAPPSYYPAIMYVLPLSIAIFAMSMANLFESTYYFFQKTYCKIPVNICSAITMGTLLYFIVPRYGTMGTAMCLVIGYIFHMLITLFVAQIIFKIRIPVFNILMTLSSAVLTGYICEFIPISFFGFGLKCVLVVLYLFWVFFVSGLVCKDETDFLINAFRRGLLLINKIHKNHTVKSIE